MNTFTPSKDWASELWASLAWIAQTWAITAVCTLVVLVVVVRRTTWGSQFWHITGDYFTGRTSIKVWLWLSLLLLLVIVNIRLIVLFTFQTNDMMTSFQVIASGIGAGDDAMKASGRQGFWLSIIVAAALNAMSLARVMFDLFCMQRFMLAWRAWLTDRLTADWLDGKAYYRLRFIDDTIDNPDQRIQSDIDIFTAGLGSLPNTPHNTTAATLLFGAISSITSIASFAAILWNLSGTLTIVGFNFPKAMFWTLFLYIGIATIIAFRIGRPIIWLSFNNEKYNAAFRYALVRLRDASEAVAFYRGEIAERTGLRKLFAPIVTNYKRYVNRMVGFYSWNFSIGQIIALQPYILQFPRFFSGQITLGDMTQSASAYGQFENGLSFFRNAYDSFAGYRAAIIRLHGLVVANEQARALPQIEISDCSDGSVQLTNVEVRTPDGDQLLHNLNLHLHPGETLMITGASGSGKTTLLRSLASLWPYVSGHIGYPNAKNSTMFLSQLPYVPLGNLRHVLCYPNDHSAISDADLRAVMDKVALSHLVDRLDDVADWATVLSPGEQQRIAFARILLTKPHVIFLDESTSALDEGLEMMLYRLVRTALPNTVIISVSHRSTVEQHHTKQLHLFGDGRWQLCQVQDQPISST